MKVTIRGNSDGYTVYIPKKDNELKVVSTDPAHPFGGVWELQGGMRISFEPQAEVPRLPLTMEVTKL